MGICAIHFTSIILVGSLSSKALQRRIWSLEGTWTFQTYFRERAGPTGLEYKALQMLLKEQVPANSPNQVLWDVSAYHLLKSPTFWHPNIIQSTNLLTPKYYPKHEFVGQSQPPSFDFQECTFDLLSFASTYTNFPALSGISDLVRNPDWIAHTYGILGMTVLMPSPSSIIGKVRWFHFHATGC